MHEHQTYTFSGPVPAHQILEKAAEIIAENYLRGDTLSNPQAAMDFLKFKLGKREHEVFAVLFLDNQNRLIEYEELFAGTIDCASIYPREVVKASLRHNAAAVMLAHNHPSGVSEPSDSDKRITQRLKDALALIDIRVLDHIVVGESCTSFAAKGWL
ncbi:MULTISPECIES: RadC family protein [Vibrio]|uniref:DNA repair protein RadC n=1 Tax=Vibrio vulnificus TaxID=672 RepID=A0AAW4HCH6_VIBVL|nr:DNA repair protein RadC [Vibrio vulnificus]EGQ8000415.1 DNA repair protein RadC [Vibrio vulnificus]EIV1853532.1 DNA repair protein RadC [Vibrio vulnificus]EJP4175110.1 DNA repair protein RadC [Vibrio vulnificus]EJV2650341.1 DNA repair protein RadC [Vibrio vulnificus]ELI0608372.1 DNA repair protein RadC [Vibrio vulnificus]